ncbi:MAG: penicillin-binding protein 2 [Acidimicrobiales bacterium]
MRWRRFASRPRRRRRAAAWDGTIRPSSTFGPPPRAAASHHPPVREPGRSGGPRKAHEGARVGLRLSIAAVVVVGMFATLLVRLWSLQVLQGRRLTVAAEQTTTREVVTPAPRGEILARGGQALADDTSEWVVTLETTPGAAGARIADPAVKRRLVALIPDLSVQGINADLASDRYSPYQPVPVAFDVPPSAVLYIEQHPSEFPGVVAQQESVRNYPYVGLATQTLGYVRQITAPELAQLARYGYYEGEIVGQSGLEQEYERYLQGKPGVLTEAVGPTGQVVREVSTKPTKPGDSIELNIDLGLEQDVARSLANEISVLHTLGKAAPLGAAVVLDPRNGQVLAMASYPSYNDNWWITGMTTTRYALLNSETGDPLNDWAVQGFQPPGSTFKLVTATAALNTGLISPWTLIDDTGSYPLPGSAPLRDADNVAVGNVNVTTALTRSSDVFFYTLGGRFWEARGRYGMTPIQDEAHLYGLGVPSGIDLPADEVQNGWVDSPQTRRLLHEQAPKVYADTWYLGDNVEMAFGQGETVVTPIQLATAYATLANGGTRYAPKLAASVISPAGKVIKRFAPHVVDHVTMSAVTRQAILTGLEGVVQNPLGTAYADFVGFNFAKWNLAGKTGTATVTVSDVVQPTSWFVAFGGPRGQAPRYVVCVEINRAGFGASAAAPVVRRIYDYLYAHGISAQPARW